MKGGEDVFLGLAGEGWRQDWEEILLTGRKVGKAGRQENQENSNRKATSTGKQHNRGHLLEKLQESSHLFRESRMY